MARDWQKSSGTLKRMDVLSFFLFLMVAACGFVCIFTFSTGINYYDIWDYYEGIFWSEATIKAAAPINPEYVYFYTLPFAANFIMAPFILLFGPTVLANQLGMTAFFLLYLAVSLYLAGTLYPEDRKSRYLFTGLMTMFVYTYVGDNLLHHILMYGIGFVCTIGELACIIRIGRQEKTGRNIVILSALCLWSALNGFSAVLSTFPVLVAFVVIHYRNHTLFRRDRLMFLPAIMVLTAAGLIVFRYFDSIALSLDQYSERLLLDTSAHMVKHLTQTLPADYLLLFHYAPKRTPVFSAEGIFKLMKLGLAVLVAAVPYFLGRKEKEAQPEQNEEVQQFLVLTNVFIITICIVQYSLTVSSNHRYLFNAVLSLFMLSAFRYTEYLRKKENLVSMLFITGTVILLSINTVFRTFPAGLKNRAVYDQLYSVLEQEGLSYGYAFARTWKVLDITSEGKCRVSTITADRGAKALRIDFDRIYLEELRKPEGAQRFFIIAGSWDTAQNIKYLKGSVAEREVNDLTIYIYDISKWDTMFASEGRP